MKPALTASFLALFMCPTNAASAQPPEAPAGWNVTTPDMLEWGALNPARENGPRAADLWGDRHADVASGFIVKFDDGFSSPPHIHNITYRGISVAGEVHNDDPSAETLWMKPGSFWTQPAGDVHITSAQGQLNLAYLEIENGPYLVQPTEDAFTPPEVEINVEESNYVWVDAANVAWLADAGDNVEIAFLWDAKDKSGLRGQLIKLPASFDGVVRADGSELRLVVIAGEALIGETRQSLPAGGYVGSENAGSLQFACTDEKDCLVYVRSAADYTLSRR